MLENVFRSQFLSAIFNMSATARIVILAVLVARLILKRAPKVFSYALWAVVLFRLLCPVSFSSEASLLSLLDAPVKETTLQTTAVEYVQSVIRPIEPAETAPPLPIEDLTAGETAVTPAAPAELAEPAAQKVTLSLAEGIYLTGVLAMGAYSLVSFLRLRRRLVGAAHLRENIYLADHIGSPFVMGILRPKIYLPSALSHGEQEYIILHEKCHIRRLDHVVKGLAFVALCLHWFNPLVWLAFILASKDMEMSCDEAVVKRLGREICADYSASLLSLATGRRIISGTPLAFGEGDTGARVKNLVGWKKPKTWIILAAGVLCAAVIAACAVNPQGQGEDTVQEQEPAILFQNGDVTVTVPGEYADLIRMDTIGSDNAFAVAANFYYAPAYVENDPDLPMQNGGWMLTLSTTYPAFAESFLHTQEPGWTVGPWASDGETVYVEQRPTAGEFRCTEEQLEMFQAVMDSIELHYAESLPPFEDLALRAALLGLRAARDESYSDLPTAAGPTFKRVDGNVEKDLVVNGALFTLLEDAALGLSRAEDPADTGALGGGLCIYLNDEADRHISLFAMEEEHRVRLRYVGDDVNESADLYHPWLYLYLVAAAEKENVELHDLDGDGALEAILWAGDDFILYDFYAEHRCRLDVAEALGAESASFCGLIANIRPEYANCVYAADAEGDLSVYSYLDGAFTYLCPLSDATQ